MFSKRATRQSNAERKKRLLKKAFERGGEEARDKMDLLIEWRLALTRHEASKTSEQMEKKYKLEEFNATDFEDSRYLSASNLVAHIEGRPERLLSTKELSAEDILLMASLKPEIKEKLLKDIAEQQPSVDRHNKIMDVIANAPKFSKAYDPEDLARAKAWCVRSNDDPVFSSSNNEDDDIEPKVNFDERLLVKVPRKPLGPS